MKACNSEVGFISTFLGSLEIFLFRKDFYLYTKVIPRDSVKY